MQANKPTNIIQVAIQRPLYTLLDYECNDGVVPEPGCRVRVPLGNSTVTALVVKNNVASEFKLKAVIDVLDKSPLLNNRMLSLLTWASQYYFYPLGEVLFHALPVALRKGKALPQSCFWKASQVAMNLAEDALKRAPKQYAMLKLLKEQELDAQQLQQEFGDTWRNILKQLENKELVDVRTVDNDAYHSDVVGKQAARQHTEATPAKGNITLTQEQQSSIEQIDVYFQDDLSKPILLHGITGSGKTEVYLRSIEPVLAAGKQALVLIPEIGLTPQLLFRFKEHFPQYNIASLHSGLSNNTRLGVWMGAKSGTIDIVIGTRSAVFTPMRNLGVILIDEEHDASFKQQEGFLYHGRDMAVKRAHDEAIPILLGSATPSLETLQNARRKRYHYLRLGKRPGASKPPEMVLQDIKALPLEAGISNLMMNEIRQHIDRQQQVMLFLNRRGFAPILMCPSCGWHAHCQHCDLGMTYHATVSKVICHHCGIKEAVKPVCPDCGGDKLTTQGQGTERIEQVLKTHFPQTPVIRIDRDSTSRKGSLEQKLQKVHSGEPVILIGTQMLTKGHDFPNLTLVGILDVDQALFSMDYRAQERLAQQVLQVAGRAGRGAQKGRVVLQTSQAEHPLLLSLLSQGYYQTARQILNERQQWHYPPYGTQALIRASSDKAEAGMAFLNKLRLILQGLIEKADNGKTEQASSYHTDTIGTKHANNANNLLTSGQGEPSDIRLLGPMPSPLAKRANRYRFQLLLDSRQRAALHALLEAAMPGLIALRKTGGVRWSIDIDPMDFL